MGFETPFNSNEQRRDHANIGLSKNPACPILVQEGTQT